MKHISNYHNDFFIFFFLITFISACNKHNSETTGPLNEIIVTLRHTLPSVLHESSGLCFTDGNLWSFGDSGNPPAIYKIDTATGVILQTVTIQNFSNEDWEDITADDDYMYIGDFGNNYGNRRDLRVLRIRKSDINGMSSQVAVDADAIYYSYTDQQSFTSNSNSNFNCEALILADDNLYLFTKDEGDLQTRCYALSKTPGTYSVSPLSSFDVEGEITSAAFNPVTKELALGGYEVRKEHPFIWFFKDYTSNHFFEGSKLKISIRSDDVSWQTEGLDYISENRLFLSCEATSDIPAALYSITTNLIY